MAEIQAATARPDLDIEADIHHIATTYPPLLHDRHRVQVEVEDGNVTVTGYVKAAPTFRYLLNNISHVPGVRSVNADNFFNDEAIRLDVGRVLPSGVMVIVEYGAVILTGMLPEGSSVEDLVKEVSRIPGVHRVITAFDKQKVGQN